MWLPLCLLGSACIVPAIDTKDDVPLEDSGYVDTDVLDTDVPQEEPAAEPESNDPYEPYAPNEPDPTDEEPPTPTGSVDQPPEPEDPTPPGSTTPCTIMLEISALSWASELGWVLRDASGTTIDQVHFNTYQSYVNYDEPQQVVSGTYTLTLRDSAGDGWNGSSVEVLGPRGEELLDVTMQRGGAQDFGFSVACP